MILEILYKLMFIRVAWEVRQVTVKESLIFCLLCKMLQFAPESGCLSFPLLYKYFVHTFWLLK